MSAKPQLQSELRALRARADGVQLEIDNAISNREAIVADGEAFKGINIALEAAIEANKTLLAEYEQKREVEAQALSQVHEILLVEAPKAELIQIEIANLQAQKQAEEDAFIAARPAREEAERARLADLFADANKKVTDMQAQLATMTTDRDNAIDERIAVLAKINALTTSLLVLQSQVSATQTQLDGIQDLLGSTTKALAQKNDDIKSGLEAYAQLERDTAVKQIEHDTLLNASADLIAQQKQSEVDLAASIAAIAANKQALAAQDARGVALDNREYFIRGVFEEQNIPFPEMQ